MTGPDRYTFAVYPAKEGDRFESFLLEVPTLTGKATAARRAWWQAFHTLGSRGIEPEEFAVCEWDTDKNEPGQTVTSAGLTEAAS